MSSSLDQRTPASRIPGALASITLLLCAPPALRAQEFERIAPREVPSGATQPGQVQTPALPESARASEEILVDRLREVILMPARAAGPHGKAPVGERPPADFEIPAREELEAAIAANHIGSPLTLASIQRLSRDIVLHYRAHDRPFVDVTVPAQDITDGVLRLVILESRLGAVATRGNRHFSSELLASRVRTRPGELLYGSRLHADLDWLNQNPFRRSNFLFTPGAAAGTTDLILEVSDRFPFRPYAGYENSGNDATGNDRWIAGFNWGNVFGIDHQLNYQFTTNDDYDAFHAHSAVYVVPLPWRHTLRVFGAHSEVDTTLDAGGGFLLDSGGDSLQAGLRYEVPLPGPPEGALSHALFAGFDFKRTDNDLLFGGTDLFPLETEILQWVFGYDAALKDESGVTSFRSAFFWSPGDWSSRNSDEAFAESRALATSDYFYGQLGLDRLQQLPADFTLLVKGLYQYSNRNLLPSEQLGAGGYSSVRGFEEREARGDEGYLVSVELRTPSLSVGRALKRAGLDDQLQFLAFWDWGQVESVDRLPGEPAHVDLSSLGLGLRYQVATNVTVRFDYGWQLNETGFSDDDSRAHLGVVVGF